MMTTAFVHGQVYNNNGMPLSAAISIPLGAVAVVALLLMLARWQRKRTERCHCDVNTVSVSCRCLRMQANASACCAQADRSVLQAIHPGLECATLPRRGEAHQPTWTCACCESLDSG